MTKVTELATGEWYEQAWALIVVVAFACFGGILVQCAMKGLTVKTGKISFTMPSLPNCLQMPPLVGMIIFGCIARNFGCNAYMQHYPSEFSGLLRIICLSIILLRGGLELDFAGKGLTMVLLTLLPQVFEASAAAIATRYILGFPWALCFAHGFTLGAVSPAVVVPSMMLLHKQGYGVAKGIPTSMIAAASFDDIIAITAFGVFSTIAFNEAPGGVEADTGIYVGWEIGNNAIQLAIGLAFGLIVGFSFIIFQKMPEGTCRRLTKIIALLVVAIAMPIATEILHIPEAKFVGIIFFGYGCFRVWGEDKPEEDLATIWMFCQPVLFGTIGAAVQFKDIMPSELGTGALIIFFGLAARWVGAFCACLEPKYTIKEKAFVAFGWIPKATVQAALGGVTLVTARERGSGEQYEQYGKQMLNMAVFAICVTAPAGAIAIAQLGPRWLEKKGDDQNDQKKWEPVIRRELVTKFRRMYQEKDHDNTAAPEEKGHDAEAQPTDRQLIQNEVELAPADINQQFKGGKSKDQVQHEINAEI